VSENDQKERHEKIRRCLAPQLIAEPLRTKLEHDKDDAPVPRHVIIELNLDFPGGLDAVRRHVRDLVRQVDPARADDALRRDRIEARHSYVFAELDKARIYKLLELDGQGAFEADRKRGSDDRVGPTVARRHLRAIFKIWESTIVHPLTTASIRTVKADAAQRSYNADGRGIVWALLDSGVDRTHPHFAYGSRGDDDVLALPDNLQHHSFLIDDHDPHYDYRDPLVDANGHGTHVAGIIAGAGRTASGYAPTAAVMSLEKDGKTEAPHLHDVTGIRGMAPMCKILSLRVLKADGSGDVTSMIDALDYIIQANADGQHILVHGANISAGYIPDLNWYGGGQSPFCREVNRAVKSGLCVVVAAGNTGYTQTTAMANGAGAYSCAGQLASINDPGNAELAITVGSTHREKPHTYGISYYSSKGPTIDGRQKPDLVAPGERIISCAAGATKARMLATMAALAAVAPETPAATTAATPAATPIASPAETQFDYVEDTGTSMAAPHVSGVLAAFLSVRPEYIGRPEDLAALLASSAMDLKREPHLQGAGLVDLMKLLASV
jgi:subtilisin family serine protease